MNKKLVVFVVAIVGMLVLALVGVPYGNFIDSTFAQYFTGGGPGGSSAADDGVNVSASSAGGVCIVNIGGVSSVVSVGTALGSGIGSFSLVKNVQASQDSNFQVLQFNAPGNVPAFEVFINKTTGECSVKAL